VLPRPHENVAGALMDLGVVSRSLERYTVSVPTPGRWPPVMRSVRRTRYLYTDVLGRSWTADDLDGWGPGTAVFSVLTGALDQLEGQRRALDERVAMLTSKRTAPTAAMSPQPELTRISVLSCASPPALLDDITWGAPLPCGCTASRAGRCVVHV